jgi:D-alanyl-D-alanine carboxypeptidase
VNPGVQKTTSAVRKSLVRAVVVAIASVGIGGCGGGSAEGLDGELAAELQRTLDEERARWQIPGAVAAVIVEGEGEWVGASGKADLETGEAMTPETLFGIGSITKSFVAALMLELAEDKVISLDDRLARWLPEYPRADRITLRQLLNHTSGVPNMTESRAFWRAQLARPFARWSPQRTLSFATGADFEPGERWHYSNTNYILLGLVIEKATGSTVAEELQHRILDPLELDSLLLQGRQTVRGRWARGYGDYDDDGKRDAAPSGVTLIPSPSEATAAWTAGAMVGDAGDVARWADALFGGHVVEPNSLREMQTVVSSGNSDYGLGIAKGYAPSGGEMWGHGGEIGGYRSEMWHVPELGLTLVTLWNDATISQDLISQTLFQVILRHRADRD